MDDVRSADLATCVAFVRQSDCRAEAEQFILEVEDGEMGVPKVWGGLLCLEVDKKFGEAWKV